MSAILRRNVDVAGGLITGGSTNVFVNSGGVVRVGDSVQSHGNHGSVIMTTGSTSVFVNGIAVCRVGDLASCGHAGTGGSPNNYVG